MPVTLLTARWVFSTPERRHERGGIVASGGGVEKILESPRAVARYASANGVRVEDLGDCVLTPGFVDAHVHLDLTALEGRLGARPSFVGWIRSLLRERSTLSRRALADSVLAGADRLLAGGTTCAGDIDSSGVSEDVLRRHPLRARIYREALDVGDPARTASAMAHVGRPFARSTRRFAGISPHAPYTVSPRLLAGLASLSKRRRWPTCIHWAETEEEVAWLERAAGPLRALLPHSSSPRKSGLDWIEASGLLGAGLTLVHGNHPSAGDVRRIARAGAVLVHCPGTSLYFRREPFPLRRWLDAGVTVALGTDGLSSNADLDMRREMALLRRSHHWISPETTFDLATRAGARALGLAGRVGEIVPGAFADLCAHRVEAAGARDWRRPRALLDALTCGSSTVARTWIAGRRVPFAGEIQPGISESRERSAE